MGVGTPGVIMNPLATTACGKLPQKPGLWYNHKYRLTSVWYDHDIDGRYATPRLSPSIGGAFQLFEYSG
jgi:hypothetical protein